MKRRITTPPRRIQDAFRQRLQTTLLAAVLAPSVALAAFGFSPPMPLNTNAAADSGGDMGPQITTDSAGNWVAVWSSNDSLGGTIGTDYDILVSRSTNSGATWTPATPLNTNAATDSGWDLEPQIETDNAGNWIAVWYSNDSLGGAIGGDYDILVSQSSDNGATWTPPAALNTNAGSDIDSGWDETPQIKTDRMGNWVAVWTSGESLGGTIGTDFDILVSRSTDNGVAWTPPAALNINAATDDGDDWTPQIATDGAGNWIVVWDTADSLGETIGTADNDILVSRSTDDGETWTAPVPLNTDAAVDIAGDAGPRITTDTNGNWLVVWYANDALGGTTGSDADILVARSTNNGVAWTASAALNTNASSDSGHDVDPHIITDGAGNWIVLWASEDSLGGTIGADSDVLVSGSTDNGATWTAPAALNSSAATDTGNDEEPRITVDSAGNWIAIWTSTESLEELIGTDPDILFSVSTAIPPVSEVTDWYLF